MPSRPDHLSPNDRPKRRRVAAGPPSGPSTTRWIKTVGARDLLSVSGTPEQRIAAIAAVQRGRVSRRQLLAAGVSASAIKRLVARGVLHPLHAGVYAVGHRGAVELGREIAALLACRDGAVLGLQTAAALWQMRPPPPASEPVHLVVVGGDTCRRAGIRVHRTRHLASRDIRRCQGLPVTAPARTLLDLAEVLAPRDLEWAADEALIRRAVSMGQIAEAAARLPNRTGAARLRALVQRRRGAGVTRGQAEQKLLALVRAAGLPEPERNVVIHGFSVDFFWPEEGVVVEVDGYRFHSTRSAFERDHRKDAVLRAADLEVARFTWDQMTQEPLAVVSGLTRTLTRRHRRPAA